MEELRERVAALERENARLRAAADVAAGNTSGLPCGDVARYGRQLILPDVGVRGQQRLLRAAVLVVGAGGLAASVVPLLAGAGVGRIGVVDGDVVAVDNLHRQVMHSEARVGVNKAVSAAVRAREVNSRVECHAYECMLTRENAVGLVREYDVVIDATDNVATRYLINDACVLCDKPLVSGSALGLHGQLSVYHMGGGPCYRCVHPTPPPAHTVTSCSDGGVLGPVPSTIGCLQAMEAIKILTACGTPMAGRMLAWDAAAATFRVLRLRPRQASCAVCGDAPSIDAPIDYEQFCGAAAREGSTVDDVVRAPRDCRWADVPLDHAQQGGVALVDVRVPVQFAICSVPCSRNVPLEALHAPVSRETIDALCDVSRGGTRAVYLVCRRGIDSRTAVPLVEALLREHAGECAGVFNVVGGLVSYHHTVDARMPLY